MSGADDGWLPAKITVDGVDLSDLLKALKPASDETGAPPADGRWQSASRTLKERVVAMVAARLAAEPDAKKGVVLGDVAAELGVSLTTVQNYGYRRPR